MDDGNGCRVHRLCHRRQPGSRLAFVTVRVTRAIPMKKTRGHNQNTNHRPAISSRWRCRAGIQPAATSALARRAAAFVLLRSLGAFERVVDAGSWVDVSFQFADGAAHHPVIDAVALFDEAGQQRLVADGVDEPRNAVAVTENAPEGRLREVRHALRAGQFEPVLDVLGDLGPRERRRDDNAP